MNRVARHPHFNGSRSFLVLTPTSPLLISWPVGRVNLPWKRGEILQFAATCLHNCPGEGAVPWYLGRNSTVEAKFTIKFLPKYQSLTPASQKWQGYRHIIVIGRVSLLLLVSPLPIPCWFPGGQKQREFSSQKKV